jgi:DNA-binding winged helix-turn-helix (wHTH) protein/Tfp pilus assembly protein PilF
MGDYQAALADALEATNLFERLEDKAGVASALSRLGGNYDALGEHSKAIDCHLRSLQISEEIDDMNESSGALNNLGRTYFCLGDYAKALDYWQRSLQRKSEIDFPTLSGTLSNIGVLHEKLGEYEKASDYYLKALRLSREVGDTEIESMCLINLGLAYVLMRNYASAREYLLKAAEVSQKIEHKHPEAIVFIYLGKLHQTTGEYDNALRSYRRGLGIAQQIGHRMSESEAFIGLGELFCDLEEYGQAADSLLQALSIAEEIGHNEYVFKAHHALSQIYERQGDFAGALKHYKAFYEIRQKVFGEEADKNLRRVMIQAEVERAQRDAEIHRLKHVELAGRVKELEEALSRVHHLQVLLRKDMHIYEFGPFKLEAAERRLMCRDHQVPLTMKVFDLLLLLVQNAGHLVYKEEIIDRLWPDSFVEENNLTVSMSLLRRALGESAEGQRYIETVKKSGYRFVAEVSRAG